MCIRWVLYLFSVLAILSANISHQSFQYQATVVLGCEDCSFKPSQLFFFFFCSAGLHCSQREVCNISSSHCWPLCCKKVQEGTGKYQQRALYQLMVDSDWLCLTEIKQKLMIKFLITSNKLLATGLLGGVAYMNMLLVLKRMRSLCQNQNPAEQYSYCATGNSGKYSWLCLISQ